MTDPASVGRDFLESWNRRDFDHWRELFDPSYTYTGGDGVMQQGPEAGLAQGQTFATGFPDGKLEINHIHVVGDTAIIEFSASGTHTGDLMGIPPTGRSMTLPVVTILEVRNGKICAEREYMDMAHLLQQLGVMPAPASA